MLAKPIFTKTAYKAAPKRTLLLVLDRNAPNFQFPDARPFRRERRRFKPKFYANAAAFIEREFVPFLIWHKGIEPDEVQQYDEVSCVSGAYGLLKLDEFMKALMSIQ